MKVPRLMIGVFFTFTGVMHFIKPRSYAATIPGWIPCHDEAVAASGAAEIAGGLAMLSWRSSRFAGPWLIALLVAVFPANLQMAINPGQVRGIEQVPRWLLWARLPLQPLAIWLVWRVWRATRPTPADAR